MSPQTFKCTDIFDVDNLQMLMDCLNQVLGIANAIIDTQGVVITSSGWQDSCTRVTATIRSPKGNRELVILDI